MISQLSLPFRLGTSSFVLLDHALPNVEWLAGKVDDVQLLFLELDGDMPSGQDFLRMQQVKSLYGLTFTIHLPALPVFEEAEELLRAVEEIGKFIELSKPLDPLGWVLHIWPNPPQDDPVQKQRWIDNSAQSVIQLAKNTGVDIKKLEVENQRDFDVPDHRAIAEQAGCTVCLDVGHVLAYGGDPQLALEQNLDIVSHIHVHGFDQRDHCKLDHYPHLGRLFDALIKAHFDGVVTMEVFGKEAFESSLCTAHQVLAKVTS